ncbi:MAG: DUF1631 family protein [Gammaproteobacteria bacterium]
MNRTIKTEPARRAGDDGYLVDDQVLASIVRPYPRGSGSASTPYQREMVIQALSVLQRESPAEGLGTDAAAIESALKVALYNAGCNIANQIVDNEKKVIAFVDHVFQVLYQETGLAAPVRRLLSRLQIPVIKLALTDFAFFRRAAHPARRLLNALVALSAGITDCEEPLFAKLADIVTRLVGDFEAELDPFEEALRAIDRAHSVESEKIREIEARFQREARVEARRLAVKRTVVAVLNQHTQNVDLPDEVSRFVVKSWAPYLAQICLRQGTQSEAWREAVDILRQIVTTAALADIPAFGIPVDAYFGQLRAKLEKWGSLREPQAAALEGARRWFINHCANAAPLTAAAGPKPEVATQVRRETLRDEEHISRLLASAPAELKPGAWFEIYRGEGKTRRRLKLSIVLEDTGRLLFADRSGRGVLELELEGFLLDLAAGRTRLIDDNNRFDQALSLVIDSIRAGQARLEAS